MRAQYCRRWTNESPAISHYRRGVTGVKARLAGKMKERMLMLKVAQNKQS